MAELLRDILVETTFAQNRAIRGNVYTIDKGILARESDLLIEASLRDSLKRERLKRVLVLGNRKVLIDENPTIGGQKQVALPLTDLRADRMYPTRISHPNNKSNYLALVIHSHGIEDLPPSPNDFFTVLMRSVFPNAAAGLMVATENFDYLIMRGFGAPQWPEDYLKMKIDLWKRNWKERHDQFTSPWYTKAQNHDINNRMQYAQIKQIARTYDLRVFKSRRGERIFTLD